MSLLPRPAPEQSALRTAVGAILLKQLSTCLSPAQPPPTAFRLKGKASVLAVTCMICSSPPTLPSKHTTAAALAALLAFSMPSMLLPQASASALGAARNVFPGCPRGLPPFTQVSPPYPEAFPGSPSKYSIPAFCPFTCFIILFLTLPSDVIICLSVPL